ncbi:type I polyketide synthase [Streptomyces sp. MS1.HAVA.3]|uniref:Type I polyketide synthase n=1 Tax=Streptomyces caledonius TaxID=3134107 RepID=A0ABU8U2C7_9ACTN
MTTHDLGNQPGAAALQSWLLDRLAALLERPVSEIDPDQGFTELGVSSRLAVTLSGELEDHLDRDLSPTLLWEQSSVSRLARFLTEGEPQRTPGETGPAGHGQTKQAVQTGQTTPAGPNPGSPHEPIAVVGVGLRLPGGIDSPDAFWRLLRDGVDAVTEVPRERWDADALYHPEAATPGRSVSKWGSFLDRIDAFDASFFDISPREADAIDPQQRLLLEVAWEAFERAGMPAESLRGSRTGVMVGISNDDYGRWQAADPAAGGPYTNTGSAWSIAANRISYFFDLLGPSLAVDTACSSSLVAVHLAVQSLRSGESDTVLAGASNLVLSPVVGVNFSASGAVSPTGRCHTFDSRADGMVRGEGVGAVVLRRLSDALRDGQPVLAVIRGSAVNQDGRTNGLMAPGPAAQTAVVRQAWSNAGVSAAEIGLVEAHGTGTPLGDPIEIGALKEAFGPSSAAGTCALGAVKSNLGHLEAAAGLAGLVKAVLCVQHGEIPGNLHFDRLNPRIDLTGSPFFVPTGTSAWPLPGGSRIAGVSSFGFGGTNAHVVVEQAPPRTGPGSSPADPTWSCSRRAVTRPCGNWRAVRPNCWTPGSRQPICPSPPRATAPTWRTGSAWSATAPRNWRAGSRRSDAVNCRPGPYAAGPPASPPPSCGASPARVANGTAWAANSSRDQRRSQPRSTCSNR